MRGNRPVTDFLSLTRPVLSTEFFPPKNEAGGRQILDTAEKLREIVSPDFVSITYGAGGSTRERTLKYATILKEDYGFEVMPHLTCVGSSKDELLQVVGQFEEQGFCNIMALRGDPPKGEKDFKPHPDGLRYASDLIRMIREHFSGFCLGAAGYPEVHPEAPDGQTDLHNLRSKVDEGASFITTQLFFNNEHFYRFEKACRRGGIDCPIVAGLMPILSLNQAKRFCGMCGTVIPDELEARLKAAEPDEEAVRKVGVEWTLKQIKDLLANGVPGIHLYILNRSESTLDLFRALQEENLLQRRTEGLHIPKTPPPSA